jgi:hypothetical protein
MRVPRFKIRFLLVLTAVIALSLGLAIDRWRQNSSYHRLAVRHRAMAASLKEQVDQAVARSYRTPLRTAAKLEADRAYHAALASKYMQAKWTPWVGVPPDPPPPDLSPSGELSRAVMDLVRARRGEFVSLDFSGVQVSDEDLLEVSGLPRVGSISLARAVGTVTPEGIGKLASLPFLERLSLPGRWTRAEVGKLGGTMPKVVITHQEAE